MSLAIPLAFGEREDAGLCMDGSLGCMILLVGEWGLKVKVVCKFKTSPQKMGITHWLLNPN